MEKFSRAFFSMKMMTVALFVFLAAIAWATFLESNHDIQTAKIIVYNALWFEILLLYLAMNLIANIFRYRMLQREKIAMLTFHVAFLVIILGAAITRFFGFEGLMIIREGERSNFIYSADPHVWFKINDGKMQYTYAEKQFMSEETNNDFTSKVEFPGHKTPILIEYVDFQKKMIDSVVVNDSIQGVAIELITEGMRSNYLSEGDFLMSGDVAVSFEKKDAMPGVHIFKDGARIMIRSKETMRWLPMAEMRKARQSGQDVPDSLFKKVPSDSAVLFQTTTLYQVGGQQLVLKRKIDHAKRMLLPSGKRNVGSDYLTLKITDGDTSRNVLLKGGIGEIPETEVFSFNGLTYEMEYGSTRIDLPFYVGCKDFRLERYPGSETASSFESDVTVTDLERNVTKDQTIFMNHVMDYRGYRFFQSSYDLDNPATPQNEEGTRLSVNHDWWGTNITYLGYLLLAVGMILSLFAPVGRFRELNSRLKKLREKREALSATVIGLVCLLPLASFTQGHNHTHEAKPIYRVMSEDHADKLSSLLVQDFQGRIIPAHTLCDQLLRKIHRGNTYDSRNAVQTIISMHMYPQHWMTEKVIQVPSNLREPLKLKEFVSYTDLADNNGQFKWMNDYNRAHRKLESRRDEYDKKLIKLVEKFEVVQAIFNWQYMKIIPVKGEPNNTWFVPLSMELRQLDTTSSIIALRYITALDDAAKTGKYGQAEDLLKGLKKFQRLAGEKVVPSETKVNLEVSYNKMGIFKNTYRSYLALGLVLLIIFFVRIFKKPSEKTDRIFKWLALSVSFLIVFMFVYQGVGLGLRWYISGHEPWSNGYEAVIFISWVTTLAGIIFSRKNPVILAGTAILASMMIFVTEMNLLDPEITPLQPVLKSYWLMIHVAVITSSYGFLGLAAILGLINLNLYIFKNTKNAQLIQINISELTYVSEMTMTIGLFMLTIGTFLGGIWANESWGRYWGWDPKETWALVSVLVYAVILHLRFIPALSGKFLFNAVSLWGYSAILFTFFGVNFYLVGLHSYAQGEGLGELPLWLKLTIVLFVLFTGTAVWRNYQFKKQQSALAE
jgi:cytochrome c-type biogenesis protein CcsB